MVTKSKYHDIVYIKSIYNPLNHVYVDHAWLGTFIFLIQRGWKKTDNILAQLSNKVNDCESLWIV